MTNKLTYNDALATVLMADNLSDEVRAKLVALQEQVNKRNKAGVTKPTKKQVENEQIKTTMIDVLAVHDGPVQAKVIAADMALSVQKTSALLKQLVAEGAVIKTEGPHKTSLFALVEGDAV